MVKAIFSLPFSILSFQCLCTVLPADVPYRIKTYDLPAGVNFESSGLAVMPNGKLAVALRKGEIWLEGEKGFQRFASGLHEILGLAFHDGALYATQRSEVTKIRDTDGDGTADEYLTAATGWGVSGNYHEYAYGPVIDQGGNLFTSLNASMGKGWKGAGESEKHALWRALRRMANWSLGAPASVVHVASARISKAISSSPTSRATGCRLRPSSTRKKAPTSVMPTLFLMPCAWIHR
jgi:hypothetical protein